MPLEFAQRIRRIPVYPAADGYALDDGVAMLASNESPFRPLPEVVAAAQRAIEGVNRYPDPTSARLRGALSERYGVPVGRVRVGFALCGWAELRTAVDQVRQPFFLNAAAQAAATEALRHQDEVARRVEQTIAARLALEEGLRALGLAPADSEANFTWFGLGEERDEEAVVRGLAERGVLVRAGASLGREGFLRVTVGTP